MLFVTVPRGQAASGLANNAFWEFSRCFYIAQTYEQAKKWPECVCLYDRTLTYASDSALNLKSCNNPTLNVRFYYLAGHVTAYLHVPRFFVDECSIYCTWVFRNIVVLCLGGFIVLGCLGICWFVCFGWCCCLRSLPLSVSMLMRMRKDRFVLCLHR